MRVKKPGKVLVGFSQLKRGVPVQKVLGQANHERLVVGWPAYGLTTVGRIYYYQYYPANVVVHCAVDAPDPGPLPAELIISLEQLDERARTLVHVRVSHRGY